MYLETRHVLQTLSRGSFDRSCPEHVSARRQVRGFPIVLIDSRPTRMHSDITSPSARLVNPVAPSPLVKVTFLSTT